MVRSRVMNTFNQLKLKLTSKNKKHPPVPNEVWHDPLFFIGFGLGSGAMPFAPGTFGTLMAIPFYLLLRPLSLPLYLSVVVVFFILSSILCDYLSRRIHHHDHGGMCIDEFAGFFVTMINAPQGFWWIIVGFLLFRLFDIWKPWPIRFLDEHVHGGFGMVLDDIVAGIYGFIIIQLIGNFA